MRAWWLRRPRRANGASDDKQNGNQDAGAGLDGRRRVRDSVRNAPGWRGMRCHRRDCPSRGVGAVRRGAHRLSAVSRIARSLDESALQPVAFRV